MPPQPVTPPRAEQPWTEPIVRVRVQPGVERVHFAAETPIVVGPSPSQATEHDQRFDHPISVRRGADGFIIEPEVGPALRWAMPSLAVTATADAPLRVNHHLYPQTIVLVAIHRPNAEGDHHLFDVINHVAMERYLPGVLHKELYASWHPSAFFAQAIAARSYAIAELRGTRVRHFDVEATTTSQVYGGAGAHDKAYEAVRQTHGMVLTYENQIVPGYYSSCCGGTGQDASLVFPYGAEIPPLQGRVRAGWCRGSRFYRWGPIARDRADLTRRMAAWGVARGHSVGGLRDLHDVRVSGVNAAGRPAMFTVTDAGGRTFDLHAEAFRFAVNHGSGDLPAVPPDALLRSAHVTPRVDGDRVMFEDGRGFGHGIGLCQHGAQGMAVHGIDPRLIVNYYYPEAQIRRIY